MVEFFINYNLTGGNKRLIPFRGRQILSAAYRNCKARLVESFKKHIKGDIPLPPYKVTIQSYQYADIDSYYKVIFDALTIAGVITDDRYVLKPGEDSEKFPIKRGQPESHYIRVEHYERKEK